MAETENALSQAAAIFVRELLVLKSGEQVLVYTDRGTDPRVADAVVGAARAAGASVDVHQTTTPGPLETAAQDLTVAITRKNYTAACELSEQYFYQTSVWSVGLKRGTRIYSLQGLDADAFVRCLVGVQFDIMDQFGSALAAVLKRGTEVRIYTDKGTDLACTLNVSLPHKVISKLLRRQNSFVYCAPSMLSSGGRGCFLGGQLAFLGMPASTSGVIAIDSYLWPPHGIGHFSDEPVLLEVAGGSVCKITGCPRKSALLNEWFKGAARPVKHFCMGFHPTATLAGEIMEAERAFGYLTVGIGDFPLHVDGIMRNPTIIVDNVPIEQGGEFVHPSLASVAAALGGSRLAAA